MNWLVHSFRTTALGISRLRTLHVSPNALFSTAKKIKVIYKEANGKETVVYGEEGQDLMRLAHENDVDLEGACEGSLACSTCHVIVEPEYYSKLPEPTDEENDMLDLAFGLSET